MFSCVTGISQKTGKKKPSARALAATSAVSGSAGAKQNELPIGESHMDSDASSTSSLAPSASDATRPHTEPQPSSIEQPARVLSFQESIQMNIEIQQRELQAQIRLQEQQKLTSQRREEQIKALSVLQQDKVRAVFKLPALALRQF
jgi:hypothetical protein